MCISFVRNISLTDCFFVLLVVFEEYLENSATFGLANVQEFRHVLLTKFVCVDNFLDAII